MLPRRASSARPPSECDVVVIGYGPVGATLANMLGQRGLSTVVLEQALDIFDRPRAAAFDHEIMRVFQEIGLDGQILPLTAPYRSSEYRGNAGQVIRRLDAAPPPWPLGWPPSVSFEQPAVEAVLRAGAAALPAVSVRLGHQMVQSEQDVDRVRVTVAAANEPNYSVTAQYAVACDGAASPVRRALGIDLEDLEFDEPWLVVDALVDRDVLPRLPESNVQYCSTDRPSTYVVMPRNHRRWELMLNPGEDPAMYQHEDRIWPLLSRWLRPGEATLWRASTYRFHALIAERWHAGRVMLAGDAAHMTPPFLAQGMCQGIRDAANLAWKLAMVIRYGMSHGALVETYRAERYPHVVHTTRLAKALGEVICERDPVRAGERDQAMLASAGGAVRTEIRENLIPGLASGILSRDRRPPTGLVFPQPRVRSGARSVLLDDVTGPCFRLVLLSHDPLDHLPANSLFRRVGGQCVVFAPAPAHCDPAVHYVTDEEGRAAAWFEAHACLAALVRPDHYVYGVAGSHAGVRALLEEFDQHLSRYTQGIPASAGAG